MRWQLDSRLLHAFLMEEGDGAQAGGHALVQSRDGLFYGRPFAAGGQQ